MDYKEFLESKQKKVIKSWFEISRSMINEKLFDFGFCFKRNFFSDKLCCLGKIELERTDAACHFGCARQTDFATGDANCASDNHIDPDTA